MGLLDHLSASRRGSDHRRALSQHVQEANRPHMAIPSINLDFSLRTVMFPETSRTVASLCCGWFDRSFSFRFQMKNAISVKHVCKPYICNNKYL